MNIIVKFFSFFLIFSFISCSQLEVVPQRVDPVVEGRIANNKPLSNVGENKKSLSELILGERSESLEYGGSITFQTALDKISFMPLSSVDSQSGVIVTDWYNVQNDELRIKLNIRIHDQNMTDESITVQMFKQRFDGQKWIDEGNDNTQASKIKKSILDEARVLQATVDLS
tara:strand:- start:949 stop:1461 length:513 start_codon:yes stop_codon:yes gene_type:complete